MEIAIVPHWNFVFGKHIYYMTKNCTSTIVCLDPYFFMLTKHSGKTLFCSNLSIPNAPKHSVSLFILFTLLAFYCALWHYAQ